MAFTIIFLLVCIAAVAYGIAKPETPPQSEPTTETPTETSGTQTYTNAKYGISFRYPDAYEVREQLAPGSALRERYSIVLIRKADLPLPTAGEGPPTITIDIYQNNLDNQTTESWIRGTNESNFKLGEGVLSSTTISGKPALSYRWSGLYEGTTIVRAEPNWIYAFSVTYLEMGADIVQDFVAIRDSVRISAATAPGEE